ncbi:MAG: aminotransferase class I/II-fold pyridoxal phosphate-dependent enzyme [Lentisphaeria bacterium]|nr:aminotransferase class I/II-fold pyridoxal phosphate-dependent enzyme [Lentisphaeria bacterium]MDY0175413.1 aminotransferase class I/II-fold pyridoxal phosphate-dependent enzyme [Lentisphaeria bacterium]
MNDSKSPRKWIAEHIAALPKSGIRDFFELVNSMDDVISLGIGEPDFATPWHIREATIYALKQGYTSYTSNLGDLRLRKEVCKYAAANFALNCDPEQECIITVGVSEGLDLLLRAVLNPGDEVLYHEPCYVSYAPGIRMTHARPVPVQTYEKHDFVLQVEHLEEKVSPRSKVLLLNYPNNPTGAGLTLADKQKLADFVIRHDLLLISDEIYEELNYIPRSPSIASLPGMHERSVVLNGFSKAYAMTGYRIAYALGNAAIIDAMMKIHQYSMLCASSIAQAAALEALRHGASQREQMRQEYEQRRNLIVRRFNQMGLNCFTPRGAFYVFPCISSSGLSSQEFATRLLHEKKVALVPGSAFGACGEGFVRCSYATSMQDIETALQRIGEFIGG